MFQFTQSMKISTMRDAGVASFGVVLVSAVLLFSGLFSGVATGLLTVLLLASGGFTSCMMDSYILRLKARQEAALSKTAETSSHATSEKTAA